MNKQVPSVRQALGFILLTALSTMGNYFSIELFLGVHFLFSSIFIFLIISYYGTFPAVVAAAISGAYTIFLWDNPYGLITLILEAWFVGSYYHRVKRDVIVADVIFLFFIAMPSSLLFSLLFIGLDEANSILIMLKQSVNMLVNVLLANLILVLFDSFSKNPGNRQASLQQILFNLFSLFFLIPLVTFLIYIGREEVESVKSDIETKMSDTSHSLTIQLNNFYHRHVTSLGGTANQLKYADEYSGSAVQKEFATIQHTLPAFKVLYAMDEEGRVIAKHARYALKYFRIESDRQYPPTKKDRKPYLSDLVTRSVPVIEPVVMLTVPIEKDQRNIGYVTGVLKPVSFLSLVQEAAKEEMKVTITDRQDKVIISNDRNQNITRPIKDSDSIKLHQLSSEKEVYSSFEQWINTSYSLTSQISKEMPWNIHVQMPVNVYKQALYEKYIKLLGLALGAALLALLVSYLLSRWVQHSLITVIQLTNNLPDKIKKNERIRWPKLTISEISNIIHNFMQMENRLHRMFSEVQAAHNNLEYLAHYDPLTHTFTRSYFIKTFQKLAKSADPNTRMALFFIDLDRFKTINDSLGHQAGDSLLIEVSSRLKAVCKENFIISRIGGDEFIVLIPQIEETLLVEQTAQTMVQKLAEPYNVRGNDYHLTASIGISQYPIDGTDSQTLLKNADMAMYSAKNNGKNNYQFYNETIKQQVLSKVEIENELRHAIVRNQLQLYYQPQIDLVTEEICGVEALIRWNHPKLGFVSPDKFISIAEETGLIIEIGEWVLQTACLDAVSWQKAGFRPVSMSVNISMRQFLHENLLDTIKENLRISGLQPSCLKLEITETVAMCQPSLVMERLQQLKQLGIELALDDFGTGYSSLNYLKKLPVDILKIDRAFINEIDQDEKDVTLVKALIEVAHSFGMTVVAEGVEMASQQAKLQSIHCDQLQGYIFSKPLPKSQIEELFQRNMVPQLI
ncbi:diguanylate cyclase (GGDEF)-like protein [Bacillus ectoiniformans]|uniref:bifunctional diguanylate cyclase/phosphodiesterase n=1 Tax=Bacillus ectoiniformans TaxID=1494429 RepID=UPI001EF800AD|nr:EAL domain-containing protein [Bacillus ectoiniformans]MBM7649874.1 diguanylate cyclase (GGDEF)-like protein [Bacillus ectoiniformans]